MTLPDPRAVLELLKPITWFAPMWAFGCGVISSGESLEFARLSQQPTDPLAWIQCTNPAVELVGEQAGIYAAFVVGGPPARPSLPEECRIAPTTGQLLGLAGAHMVFNPNATKPGLSNRLWEVEGPCAAVANGYFVLQPNRVGREDNEYGELAVDFYGTSQVIDPRGNFVGERGSSEHEEVLIRDLDMDMVQQMRDDWQFYRDRRPDSYTLIAKP